MLKVLIYTFLFRNTSFYILAVFIWHTRLLLEDRKPQHFSCTLLPQPFAKITSVHSRVLQCIRVSCPDQVKTLPYTRDCKLGIFSRTHLKKMYKNNVFENRAEFFLRESKSSETKAVEGCCWAITQAAGRSCCGWSGSRVWNVGFNLTPLCTSHNWPQVHSVPTCAQFDLRRPLQDVITA